MNVSDFDTPARKLALRILILGGYDLEEKPDEKLENTATADAVEVLKAAYKLGQMDATEKARKSFGELFNLAERVAELEREVNYGKGDE